MVWMEAADRPRACIHKPYEVLGRGGFSKVFSGSYGGIEVAVKRMENGRYHSHVLKREIDILKGCNHKNIVKYFSCDNDDDFSYIVLERCHFSLKDYVNEPAKDCFSTLSKYQIFFESASGIDYLHRKNIVHRDIKPSNILLKKETARSYVVLITDFGMSKCQDLDNSAFTISTPGTTGYNSAEVLGGSRPTKKSDIFSLGIVFYEVDKGFHPFGKAVSRDFNITNRKKCSLLSSSTGNRRLQTINQMLKHEPDSRPTASEVRAATDTNSHQKETDEPLSQTEQDTRRGFNNLLWRIYTSLQMLNLRQLLQIVPILVLLLFTFQFAPDKITCGLDGSWSGKFPQCSLVQCEPPAAVEYGRIKCTKEDYAVGSVCTVDCLQHHMIKGENGIVCESSGKWSHDLPSCECDDCRSGKNFKKTTSWEVFRKDINQHGEPSLLNFAGHSMVCEIFHIGFHRFELKYRCRCTDARTGHVVECGRYFSRYGSCEHTSAEMIRQMSEKNEYPKACDEKKLAEVKCV